MRTFRVVVSGNEYEVAIEEITEKATAPVANASPSVPKPAAAPVARKATPAAPKSAPKADDADGTILAAMPGTITDVKVNQGDQVKRGDTLLILEAMKMENEIKAHRDGIVSAIQVDKGASVNAGMALLVLA
ncbi:biotin/lipoyl-containing protein [Desulfosediminicola flagellatus]|uniref:biotin/lipoyl-containing protein n=1 Tax=Desulfosediminicola flagellatus TaxID=2569541 RepID=UPI0010AB842A|nr:biotin/lipoyl-containing protein [Desulfosediminicola flagellatus]